MGIYSVMFAAATALLSLPSLTTGRGAPASFAAGVSLAPLGRYVARFMEIIVFAMLLALITLPAPARAQTITINSVTATPATVQPGQTVVFTATITANQNASNYPVLFSLHPPGASAGTNTTQGGFSATFHAGTPLTGTYSWTVPAGTSPGAYSMQVSVYNPTWSVMLASRSTTLTITAASKAAAPMNLEPPVVSGTAQVGQVLASTTGTWTGAISFAYQWAGNMAPIAGATAAMYTPVSSDVGHTLTSTVTATGSSGATASATSAPTVPIVAASSGGGSGSGAVSFVALHTYYMSPTGSDSNNGLTVATAWATPNHPVVCGDVIIAATGTYGYLSNWGHVSNCPSTSGGIDGTGGIYFAVLLCGGSDLTSCADRGQRIAASNWAAEGFASTNPTGFCHLADASATNTTQYAFVAFINEIARNCDDGYTTGDGGKNHNVPGNGVDEFAVIGSIAQNANQDPICVAAIDDPGPSASRPFAGTHVIFDGNFGINNAGAPNCQIDGEAMMFDTFDAHGYNGQAVIENNIAYLSARYGINLFQQHYNPSTAPMFVFNNTLFANNSTTYSLNDNGGCGDLNSQGVANGYVVKLYSNIVQTKYARRGGVSTNCYVYAALEGGLYSDTWGGAGLQNIFLGEAGHCASSCDSTNSVVAFNTTYATAFGSNAAIYENPGFANTADLLANHTGAPTCAGFTTTTACMAPVIADLTATASGTAGKGYQRPGACAPDPYYPTWLKGIVYLHWNGSSMTENAGLVNKPCGL
jgi:hypothetical protein